jgi:23S rRNA (pseudouridine1915-N3)-methyltransferase
MESIPKINCRYCIDNITYTRLSLKGSTRIQVVLHRFNAPERTVLNTVKITLTSIAPRRTRSKSEATDRLLAEYIDRAAHYVPCDSQVFESESAFLDWLDKNPSRTPAKAILLDSRGQQYTSEEFAGHLGRLRDDGAQRLVVGIGPADGWSASARQRANLLFSLGRITLPHQLARVVLAEQVYRALTILAGHPYHSGH